MVIKIIQLWKERRKLWWEWRWFRRCWWL